jgi:hypothetical protein
MPWKPPLCNQDVAGSSPTAGFWASSKRRSSTGSSRSIPKPVAAPLGGAAHVALGRLADGGARARRSHARRVGIAAATCAHGPCRSDADLARAAWPRRPAASAARSRGVGARPSMDADRLAAQQRAGRARVPSSVGRRRALVVVARSPPLSAHETEVLGRQIVALSGRCERRSQIVDGVGDVFHIIVDSR